MLKNEKNTFTVHYFAIHGKICLLDFPFLSHSQKNLNQHHDQPNNVLQPIWPFEEELITSQRLMPSKHRQNYTQQAVTYCNKLKHDWNNMSMIWFILTAEWGGADVIWVAYPGSFPPQYSQLGCNRSGSLCCPNQPFGGDGAFCSK